MANHNDVTGSSHSKVGVFMPCYNLGPFIQEALDSLYNQSFQDFVLIIADDASTDTETIATLQQLNLPRCQVFFEPQNLGVVGISNKYMSQMNVDYLLLFSPDDVMEPGFLAAQVKYLDAHPEVSAVCTWLQQFGEADGVLEYTDEKCTLPWMLVSNYFAGSAMMRAEAFRAAGMHDPSPKLHPHHDYDLWLSMLSKGLQLRTIPEVLIRYRIRGNSLSHSAGAQENLRFRRALVEKYSSLYAENMQFVLDFYLTELEKFDAYYAVAEEGRAWLDGQYHSLSAEVGRLSFENERLRLQLSEPRPGGLRNRFKR